MTLKEKVQFIIDKYNNGQHTSYSDNMIYAIEQWEKGDEEYTVSHETVTRNDPNNYFPNTIYWVLCHVLGECILLNDKGDIWKRD